MNLQQTNSFGTFSRCNDLSIISKSVKITSKVKANCLRKVENIDNAFMQQAQTDRRIEAVDRKIAKKKAFFNKHK